MSEKNSTAHQEPVFVRLPVRRKENPWMFAEIDPQRLNLLTFSRLYHQVNARGGKGTQYYPLPESPFPEIESIARGLKLTIKEQGEQFKSKFQDAEQSEYMRLVELALNDLVDTIVYRDATQAQDHIRQLFGSLELIVQKLTNDLQTSRQNEEVLTELASSAEASRNKPTSTDDDLKHEIYITWGDAVLNINIAAQTYKENYDRLRRFAEEVEGASEAFALESTDPEGDIMKGLEFLDPQEGSGFVSQALAKRGDTDLRSFRTQIEEAKKHIERCNAMLSMRRTKHADFRRLQFELCGTEANDMTPLKAAENACAELAEKQLRLGTYRKTHPRFVGPHEKGFVYVSADAYEEAMSYVPNNQKHDWHVGTRRRLLRTCAEKIRTRLEIEPDLPARLREAIAIAQPLIKEFECRLLAAKGDTCSPPTSASSVSPSQEVIVDQQQKEESQISPAQGSFLSDESSLNLERLNELCELVTCVGFVCTYQNQHPNGAKSTKGILKVLVEMGRCTNDELMAYSKAISERLRTKSEHVENAKEAQRKQKTSDCDWVHYQEGHSWRRRLTKKAMRRAVMLLEKYQLTSRSIEQANKRIGQNYRSTFLKS